MTTLPERLQALIADMDLRFKSGNSVPVRTVQLTAETWAEIRAALEAATALQSSGGEVVATCSYPKCNCPFDAPADPNWCARGLQRHQSEPLSPWPLFHVNGLPELSGALVRAVQKGYLPDALAAVVEAFDWLPASTTASPAQPSGFVLVPVEPTRKMCDDAVHAAVHGSHGSPWFPHAWRAALKAAAAPAPIEQEG